MTHSNPEPPRQPSVNSISPQDQAENKGTQPPVLPPFGSDVVPAPEGNNDRHTCKPDQTPWWKYLIELAAVLTAVYYASIATRQLGQMESSSKQTDQLICLYQQQVARLSEQVRNTTELARQAKNQVDIAQRTFSAAQRPYVGVSGITPNPNAQYHVLLFSAEVKNFGTVPGTDFTLDWDIWIGGVKQPMSKLPDAPDTIFPGQPAYLTSSIGDRETYDAIMTGAKTLELEIVTRYRGPEGYTAYCEKNQYEPKLNRFYGLGRCTKRP